MHETHETSPSKIETPARSTFNAFVIMKFFIGLILHTMPEHHVLKGFSPMYRDLTNALQTKIKIDALFGVW